MEMSSEPHEDELPVPVHDDDDGVSSRRAASFPTGGTKFQVVASLQSAHASLSPRRSANEPLIK